VVVSASTLEEVLEGVTLQAVMQAFPPDFVVIGESTELNIARGGRGRAEIHLQTIGKPSHSSSPHLGRNAVLDMMNVVGALEGLELPSDPLMGPAILALTDIVSDPYPGHSVIPSVCKVTYDRRLLPGETEQGVLEQIRNLSGIGDIRLIAEIGVGDYRAWTGVQLQAKKFFPAWSLPAEDAFVHASLGALTLAGMQPTSRAYRFCTNAAYSAGTAGVPTIGFGPGSESDAHVTDERLRLQDLYAAAEGYGAIIMAVLGS
jgi:putative selenium metabolism hydrolase